MPSYNVSYKIQDLISRVLSFLNDNRPARQHMYFHYTMAHIHAQLKRYPNLSTKVPAGRIWASPDRSAGYLRGSVLRALPRGVGDEDLPEELITAGTFADTMLPIASPVWDQTSTIDIAHNMKAKFDGRADEDDEEVSKTSKR